MMINRKYKIKFSHDYPKLHGQKKAILLDIKCTDREKLHPDLIEYDTKNCNGDYYELPKGKVIILYFTGEKDIPFCTIRRYTASKYDYYYMIRGETFDIVIGTEETKNA